MSVCVCVCVCVCVYVCVCVLTSVALILCIFFGATSNALLIRDCCIVLL